MGRSLRETAGPRKVFKSPTVVSRRCFASTSIPPWRSPGRPDPVSRWPSCFRPIWRPPGHGRFSNRRPSYREGVSHRRVFRHGDRRGGRTLYRDGQAVSDRAGDRRATEGFQIADRRIEKVFRIDEYSAMAIAGAAGPCIEMAKLFQTELEHYEKLEGVQLSCEGKANKLGQMVKANLPMVFQGLVVMPLD